MALKNKYEIFLCYITTNNPEINVARVRERVKEGGHDVPEEKIRSRYDGSMELLQEILPFSHEAIIIDNSENNDPKEVFLKIDQQFFVRKRMNEEIPKWVIRYITDPLEKKGHNVSCVEF